FPVGGPFVFSGSSNTGSVRPAAGMKTRREHRLHDPRAIPSSCSHRGEPTVAQPARHCAWTHARWTQPFRTSRNFIERTRAVDQPPSIPIDRHAVLNAQADAFAQLLGRSPDDLDDAWRKAAALADGLFPHQVEGVAFLLGRRRAILADDMGLGKTRQP